MVTCPWCGTSYATFQPNCTNCGGPLRSADFRKDEIGAGEEPPAPPPAPRPIPDQYAWRLASRDGGAIAAFVFGILGIVFSLVGVGLTFGVITAFIGIPFLLAGLAFLAVAAAVFLWRYQIAKRTVLVLREGLATRGQIIETQPNYSVRINGRNPWVIRYQFQANGQEQAGQVTTLNQPGEQHQSGKPAWILYLPASPGWNSIYPHP